MLAQAQVSNTISVTAYYLMTVIYVPLLHIVADFVTAPASPSNCSYTSVDESLMFLVCRAILTIFLCDIVALELNQDIFPFLNLKNYYFIEKNYHIFIHFDYKIK